MSKFKAVFFDRDGTLTRTSERLFSKRDRYISKLIGRDFTLTYDMDAAAFTKAGVLYPGLIPVNTPEKEIQFWKRWYQMILSEYGIADGLEEMSDDLYDRFSYHKMLELYPETKHVLEHVKSKGYKIGAISNTFPSLENSLEVLGISKYFDSFTASSLVGVEKPEPGIFRAALETLGVEARQSIFVDDYNLNTDGSRELGFTSFFLNRAVSQPDMKTWTIGDLIQLIKYLDNN